MSKTLILLLAFTGIANGKTFYFEKSTAGCTIEVRQDIAEPQPLIIWPGTSEFVTPGGATDGIIRLNAKTEIELFCTNGFRPPFDGNIVIAQCLEGNRFIYNREEYLFSEFVCLSLPTHTARHTGRPCGDMFSSNTTIAEIGFIVDNRFLHLIDSCHDDVLSSNLWVHYYQNPDNHMFQSGYPRINFIQGNFFQGLRVDNLYSIAVQRRTIGAILNSEELSWDIIPGTQNLFMARGHLAAKTDFIFGVHQQATFYFINTAPQFQSFNGGNWMFIESGVRQFIAQRRIYTEIWTGTYGVVSFPDVNGNHQKIYLSVDQNGVGRIPVPKLYYKVVIDVANAAGIVFIGVNNPHLTLEEIQRDYIICDDVSDVVTYLPRWQRNNITLGYGYACEVEQFAKRVGHLPKLPFVKQLLI